MQKRPLNQYLLQLSCFFVLVMAVIPSVTFFGHWEVQPLDEHSHVAATAPFTPQEGDDGEHTSHCHVGPASCAGGVAMVGAIWIGEDAGLLAMNGSQQRLWTGHVTPQHEAPTSRILQPPQFAF